MTTIAARRYRAPIQAVDLFCGVGGLSHGLIRGGIDVVAGIDIDEACRYPYETNNPATFILKDVNELSAAYVSRLLTAARLTLLAGCAPCQPFSTYSRSGRQHREESDWELVTRFGKLVRIV